MRPPFTSLFAVALALALVASAPVHSADDPVGEAMKLYEKRRYEQAARMLEDALARLEAERRPQAQLVLGMIYVRNADLHEALARTAAAAELDYLDKLLKTRIEDRSRYARLYLAEALLARGNAAAAGRHFEQARADPGIESRYQAIASVGLGSVLWTQRDAERARGLWTNAARTGGAAEITLARAAAQGRAQAVDVKSLQRVADDASHAPELSPRARRYLIEIYTAAGAPDKALAVARAADLGMASYVERFKAV